jgi:hypothetical protein
MRRWRSSAPSSRLGSRPEDPTNRWARTARAGVDRTANRVKADEAPTVTPDVRGWSLLLGVVLLILALTGLMVAANAWWPSTGAHAVVYHARSV